MLQTASEARRSGYEAFAAEARVEAARQEADAVAAASSVTRLTAQLAQAESQLSTAEDAAADLQAQLEERDSALRQLCRAAWRPSGPSWVVAQMPAPR